MTADNRRDENIPTTTAVAPPGTWLADVDRDVTVHIVQLINLAVAGLEVAKNRILVGVDMDGAEPAELEDRADYVRDTAREALTDIGAVRNLVALATSTIACAAVDIGTPYEEVCEWAGATDGDRVLRSLNEQLVHGVEPALAALVGELAHGLLRTSE